MITTMLLTIVCSSITNECNNYIQDVWTSDTQQGYVIDIQQCVQTSKQVVAKDVYYVRETECFSES